MKVLQLGVDGYQTNSFVCYGGGGEIFYLDIASCPDFLFIF